MFLNRIVHVTFILRIFHTYSMEKNVDPTLKKMVCEEFIFLNDCFQNIVMKLAICSHFSHIF